MSLLLKRLSFSPGEVHRSVLGSVYAQGILEQGVMLHFLSATVADGNELN